MIKQDLRVVVRLRVEEAMALRAARLRLLRVLRSPQAAVLFWLRSPEEASPLLFLLLAQETLHKVLCSLKAPWI